MGVHATVVAAPGGGASPASEVSPAPHPIVVNTTKSTTGKDLSDALERVFGPGRYCAGGQALAGMTAPGFSLPEGAVLGTSACPGAAAPMAPPHLVMVTHRGPDAGRIIMLHRGRYRLGRPGLAPLPGCTSIEFRDPALSRLHAELLVTAGGIQIKDAASRNGVWVDGRLVAEAGLSTASVVRAGNTTFRICVPESVQLPAGGQLSPGPLTVPAHPPGPRNPAVLLTAVLALGLGVMMALMTGMWMFLAFSALTAITAFAGFAATRRRGRRFRLAAATTAAADKDRRLLAHPTSGDRALGVLLAACPPQRPLHAAAGSTHQSPDPSATFPAPDGHGPGQQPNAHANGDPAIKNTPVLCLGTGTLPANIVLQTPKEDWDPPLLDDVPVALKPASGAWIRVAGPAAETMGMLRSALLQLAAGQPGGPRPVVILCREIDSFICDARLLPGSRLVSISDLPAAAAAIEAIARRSPSAVLTVLAPPSVSVEALRLREVLTDETRQSVLFLAGTAPDGDAASGAAPAGGAVSILLREDVGTLLSEDTEQRFHPDLIGPLAFHRTAALLALISTRSGRPGRPPDLFPMSSSEIEAAWASWADAGELRAVLGYQGTTPVSLSLLADGPHFLVAGTTGSGKSELLRTFILSLAAAVPPATLNFLLIDFKGGSGLAPLTRLPHTAGFLTDLSGENVARTLTSLRSELRRRESLLAASGASDLDGFNGTAPPHAAIPRLVVVVDEFRMLADAVPNAVDELMRIAVLGRSLGLHLMMATQRPQGAVTADIRANVSTAICLRVQSALDSRDVVGCDDAADIPAASPGSAILRRAGSAAFPFTVSSTAAGAGKRPPLVQTLAQYLATPLHLRGASSGRSLDELIEAVCQAAAAAGFPAQAPQPVRPPLPLSLPHGSLPDGSPHGYTTQSAGTVVSLGLADRPDQQRQDPLEWNPARDSHLAMVGPGPSGTTAATALLAAGHLTRLPAAHLYVLDGDGSLSWTAASAQTGAYVAPHETRRAARVLTVLGDIVLQRLAHGSGPGAGGFRGPGATSHKGPAGVGTTLVISSWGRWQEVFRSSRFQTAEDELLGLVRDGEAAGVCLVISGNRELPAARFFQLIPNRLWFPCGLPDDAVVAWPRMPLMESVPGRAYVQGRIGAPAGAVAQCGEPPESIRPCPLPAGTPPPQRVDPLPGFAGTRDLAPASGPDRFPLGLYGDELDTAEVQLRSGCAFLVLGPPGSGRTALLRRFGQSAEPELAVHTFGPACYENTCKGPKERRCPTDAQDLRKSLILVDDADRLPLDAHHCLSPLLDRGARLVLAAAPGFGLSSRLPLAARLRAEPCGALLAPGQQADAEFFGIRPALDASPRPGRGYLIAGAKVTETQFAFPD